jgi:hypothetical protein
MKGFWNVLTRRKAFCSCGLIHQSLTQDLVNSRTEIGVHKVLKFPSRALVATVNGNYTEPWLHQAAYQVNFCPQCRISSSIHTCLYFGVVQHSLIVQYVMSREPIDLYRL